jgi:adenylate cyclase
MSEQRRLAAILVADVVSYSKLVGADEAGTLTRLQSLRASVIEPAIDKHSGRLFKAVGDGFLVEFASAVQAVTAAQAIQQANAGGALLLRIGIHVGDVVVQGDDLMGDGVNIAARIEGVADAGGIAISREVFSQVRDRLSVSFDDKGEIALKNIARPVQVFAIAGMRAPIPDAILNLPDKPSIAVLPLQNMSGDPEKEYFSDGISEDIITNLSRLREFHVLSRNSTFSYKGDPPDVGKVGRDLKAAYVVQGSVRSIGTRVRITVQLISVITGAHIWAERYDRELTDVFAVQDDITVRIATAIDPAIRRVETQMAMRKQPTDLAAWDRLLRGLSLLNQFKKPSNSKGRFEFEAAIRRDPGYAAAHAWRAVSHVLDAWFNWTETHAVSLQRARRAAAEAVKSDDTEPMSHAATAMACFWSGRVEQALRAAERTIALNPNSFLGNFVCGTALNYSGRCEEAVDCHRKALDLSPHDPLAWNCLGSFAHTEFNRGKYDAAVALADRAIVQRHGYLFGRVVKVAALAQASRVLEARAASRALLDVAPDFSEERFAHYPFILASQRQHLLDGLRVAELIKPSPTRG